jgi:hypothetical protein
MLSPHVAVTTRPPHVLDALSQPTAPPILVAAPAVPTFHPPGVALTAAEAAMHDIIFGGYLKSPDIVTIVDDLPQTYTYDPITATQSIVV